MTQQDTPTRTALVTGSTDGIGAAVARRLAADGALVIVTGRDLTRGEKVVAGIAEAGGRAVFVRSDLAAGASAVRALAETATARAGGPLDVLVHNAARLVDPGPTADVAPGLFDEAVAVSVRAPFLLTGLLAPAMAARGRGAIVLVGSINGLVGMAGSALYSMTKAAVHSLASSWAAEYGPSGVRVNTVAPGPTSTERNERYAARLAPLLARAPSRRASTPEEVAAAVSFLAGEEAGNVHATTLTVDGGFSAV